MNFFKMHKGYLKIRFQVALIAVGKKLGLVPGIGSTNIQMRIDTAIWRGDAGAA